MPTYPVRTFWQFPHAALFAALLFLSPAEAEALALPDTVTLETPTFVQIIDKDEMRSWYTEEKRFALTLGVPKEFEDAAPACEKVSLFCQAFLSRATREHIVLRRTFELAPDRIVESIQHFAAKADREPKNAKLSVQDSKIIITVPAEDGIVVDTKESVAALVTALRTFVGGNLSVLLKSVALPAKVSEETLAHLGITELIGTATTNFRGSPKNRVYNIRRAIQDFDGIVIDAGATFSFVDHLGEVDGEHGYLPELVIKNNKTEPEFGGGICQVSTTVFRVAIQSGLKITERKNHAYPVQYYKPYGMDATIYIPKPDLQFRNNTPGSILLVPEMDSSLLTFSMYGTSDGRTTSVDGPHILESHPDGSMKTVFTQTVTDSAGQTFINDSFWSNYKSPSLFPHPGDEPIYTTKPKDWSEKQWREYKRIRP